MVDRFLCLCLGRRALAALYARYATLCAALFAGLLTCAGVQVASAKEAVPEATDPVLETHVMRIAQDLRCLVCQNESLAASHADLAVDLRQEIREKLRQGQTDDQIRAFMVARYGDFVLFKPPVKSTTWLLWAGPFLLLCGAVVALGFYVRQRGRLAPSAPLSEAEHLRANELLRSATLFPSEGRQGADQ